MPENRDPLSAFFEAFDPARVAEAMQGVRRQVEAAFSGTAAPTAPEAMAQAREQLARLEQQWRESMQEGTERVADQLRAFAQTWSATPFGAMAGAAADALDKEIARERERALATLGIASTTELEMLAARVAALEKRFDG